MSMYYAKSERFWGAINLCVKQGGVLVYGDQPMARVSISARTHRDTHTHASTHAHTYTYTCTRAHTRTHRNIIAETSPMLSNVWLKMKVSENETAS